MKRPNECTHRELSDLFAGFLATQTSVEFSEIINGDRCGSRRVESLQKLVGSSVISSAEKMTHLTDDYPKGERQQCIAVDNDGGYFDSTYRFVIVDKRNMTEARFFHSGLLRFKLKFCLNMSKTHALLGQS